MTPKGPDIATQNRRPRTFRSYPVSLAGKSGCPVGYGRPPKHSRFQPGTSGNPSGRPPGKKKQPRKLPSIFPTRTLLAEEASRLVTIREGDKRLEIPATEAVLRALAMKAMQGGVLAARTYLQYQMAEDEREAAERKERFDFWHNYVRKERKRIDQAREQDKPLPDPVPHPDDIEFNYHSREVQFHGPMNAEEAAAASRSRVEADLYYELSIYLGEADLGMFTDDEPVLGGCMFLHILEVLKLPKRLRPLSAETSAAITSRMMGRKRDWESYLESKCRELNLPLELRKMRARAINLRDLGMRFGPNGLEAYKWPKSKPQKK